MKFKLFECKKDVLCKMFFALLFYFVFGFMQTLKKKHNKSFIQKLWLFKFKSLFLQYFQNVLVNSHLIVCKSSL